MQGRRIYPDENCNLTLKSGDYGKDKIGRWFGRTPNGIITMISNHELTEHQNGTITVSPSIVVNDDYGRMWHGYLEKGIWREV